jgi:hypothetical protein
MQIKAILNQSNGSSSPEYLFGPSIYSKKVEEAVVDVYKPIWVAIGEAIGAKVSRLRDGVAPTGLMSLNDIDNIPDQQIVEAWQSIESVDYIVGIAKRATPYFLEILKRLGANKKHQSETIILKNLYDYSMLDIFASHFSQSAGPWEGPWVNHAFAIPAWVLWRTSIKSGTYIRADWMRKNILGYMGDSPHWQTKAQLKLNTDTVLFYVDAFWLFYDESEFRSQISRKDIIDNILGQVVDIKTGSTGRVLDSAKGRPYWNILQDQYSFLANAGAIPLSWESGGEGFSSTKAKILYKVENNMMLDKEEAIYYKGLRLRQETSPADAWRLSLLSLGGRLGDGSASTEDYHRAVTRLQRGLWGVVRVGACEVTSAPAFTPLWYRDVLDWIKSWPVGVDLPELEEKAAWSGYMDEAVSPTMFYRAWEKLGLRTRIETPDEDWDEQVEFTEYSNISDYLYLHLMQNIPESQKKETLYMWLHGMGMCSKSDEEEEFIFAGPEEEQLFEQTVVAGSGISKDLIDIYLKFLQELKELRDYRIKQEKAEKERYEKNLQQLK